MSTLQGNNVILRPIRVEDYPQFIKWGQDEELGRLMEGDYPDSPDACVAWHKSINSDRHRQVFAIQHVDGHILGDIELDHIAWRSGDAELRIRIGEKQCWGQGYGTEAVGLMLEHAFTGLNLRRVYLRVFAFNKRAIASYRKAGFKPEGVLTRRTAQGERKKILLMRIKRDEFVPISVEAAQGIAVEM